jgi:hypothetical protein
VLELVRDRERLENRLVDGAELLGLVEKRLQIKFSKVRQLGSSPFVSVWGSFASGPIRTAPSGPTPHITRKSRPGFPI